MPSSVIGLRNSGSMALASADRTAAVSSSDITVESTAEVPPNRPVPGWQGRAEVRAPAGAPDRWAPAQATAMVQPAQARAMGQPAADRAAPATDSSADMWAPFPAAGARTG